MFLFFWRESRTESHVSIDLFICDSLRCAAHAKGGWINRWMHACMHVCMDGCIQRQTITPPPQLCPTNGQVSSGMPELVILFFYVPPRSILYVSTYLCVCVCVCACLVVARWKEFAWRLMLSSFISCSWRTESLFSYKTILQTTNFYNDKSFFFIASGRCRLWWHFYDRPTPSRLDLSGDWPSQQSYGWDDE